MPHGTAETRAYDAARQLTSVTDALNQTVQYAYDLDGRQTSLTDARGNTRAWTFDSVGRLAAKTYPDATSESYTYRADGSLATHTTPAGAVETYTYNAKGQITLRDWSNATPDVTYAYDSNGRATSLASSDATIAWTYDVLDRKLTEKQTVQPMGTMKTVSYTYDADGRTSGITPPGASKRNYTYTARGQLAAVTMGTAFNPVASYAYNLAGEMATLTRSNNLLTTYTHDAAGQLAALAHTRNGNAVDSLAYTLDAMGRRTAITRPGGKSDSYSYDLTGQVTGASYGALPAGAGNETFAYDPAGNRTGSTQSFQAWAPASQSYTTNALDQYTSVNGQAQSHDLDGNILTMQLTPAAPVIVNGYDSENRMVSTETTGNTRIDNRYDALHRRVLKQMSVWDSGAGTWVLQKTVRFTYDAWNVIEEEELTASTTRTVRYTWGTDVSGTLQGAGGVGGLLRADETVGASAATTHYYWYDGDGNVTGLMRSNGTVDATHRYTAFGGEAESTVTLGTFAERNRYRFSTKYLDDEVETAEGTYYYGYRHYLTALGRWGVRDPIRARSDLNLYGFNKNKVPSRVDLFGLLSVQHNSPDPTQITPTIIKLGDSGTGYSNESVTCTCECKTEVSKGEIENKRYYVKCTVSWSAAITLSESQARLRGVTLEKIYGHEQKHIQSAKSRVESGVVQPLEKEKERFTGSGASDSCEKSRARYESDYTKKLKGVLQNSDPDHKGDGKGQDTPYSPKDGEPIDPLPNSVWPPKKK